jgi:hypothetical protein
MENNSSVVSDHLTPEETTGLTALKWRTERMRAHKAALRFLTGTALVHFVKCKTFEERERCLRSLTVMEMPNE